MHPLKLPELGFGLGLRPAHYEYIFNHHSGVDWFEIISENFMDTGGKARRNLDRVRANYPIVMHGVSLSLGTVDPLHSEYLRKLKQLANEIQPAWISDHLCWTGVAHRNTHDLLPIPYTQEALAHVVSRIRQVQDIIGQRIAIENPSTYLEFNSSTLSEADFLAEMALQADCLLLLDVNNVYVTCYNHALDPKTYLDTLPLERVIQIHLSGHTNMGSHIIDTHDDHVRDEVLTLYQYVINRAGRVPNTMIEWDGNIPEFPILYAELDKAKIAAQHAAKHDPLPQLAAEHIPYRMNSALPLRDEQLRMQNAIMQGSALADIWIRHKQSFPASAQLGVYIDAYRARLYEVVAEDYPVLCIAMGELAFTTMLNLFITSTVSDHFNIGRYALRLPAFVAHYAKDSLFLSELATLETDISQVADAAETAALTPEDLKGITPDDMLAMKLTPRAALQLRAFSYPINTYYQAVQDNMQPELPEKDPCHLVIVRHDDILWRMELEQEEYQLFTALCAGATIGEVLERLDEHAADSLFNWFSRWMRNGLLAQLS